MQTELRSAAGSPRGRHRRWLPVLAVLAVLGIAVAAATLGRPAPGQVGTAERLSAAATTLLSDLAAAIPLGYAFGAGMVAAANPCGFALLPTYLGLYLGADSAENPLGRRLLRAAAISLTVSACFVLLFGLAGLVLAATPRL